MEFDRRTLLKGTIGLVGSSIVSERTLAHEPTEIEPSIRDISFEQSRDQLIFFDFLKDKIPESMEYNIHTEAEIDDWVQEAVPFFEYEGITDPKRDVGEIGGLQYPDDIHFQYYDDGLRHNHILGTTNIFDNEVTLNERYSNPVSPFYTRGDSVTTLLHELAHAQGIKSDGNLVNCESSAQLAMLEIASSMLLKGNTLVLDSLVGELVDMNYATLKYIALRDNRIDEFRDVLDEVFPDPMTQASINKSDRFWADDPDRLQQILHDYNFTPINEISKAHRAGQQKIEGVYLPKNWITNFGNVDSYYPSAEGSTVPNPKNYTEPLVIDDLTYFMENSEAIVDFLTNGN